MLGATRREFDRLWSHMNKIDEHTATLVKLTEQMSTVVSRLDDLAVSKKWRAAQGLAFLAAIAADTLTHLLK